MILSYSTFSAAVWIRNKPDDSCKGEKSPTQKAMKKAKNTIKNDALSWQKKHSHTSADGTLVGVEFLHQNNWNRNVKGVLMFLIKAKKQ